MKELIPLDYSNLFSLWQLQCSLKGQFMFIYISRRYGDLNLKIIYRNQQKGFWNNSINSDRWESRQIIFETVPVFRFFAGSLFSIFSRLQVLSQRICIRTDTRSGCTRSKFPETTSVKKKIKFLQRSFEKGLSKICLIFLYFGTPVKD